MISSGVRHSDQRTSDAAKPPFVTIQYGLSRRARRPQSHCEDEMWLPRPLRLAVRRPRSPVGRMPPLSSFRMFGTRTCWEQPHLTSQSPSFGDCCSQRNRCACQFLFGVRLEERILRAQRRGGFITSAPTVSHPPRQQLMDQEERSVMRPTSFAAPSKPFHAYRSAQPPG